MLRCTRCKPHLLSGDAMFSMIRQNLRGGVAVISKRLGKPNNKYMKQHYDRIEQSKYPLYVDAHNLHRWSKSPSLPDGKLGWTPEAEWSTTVWLLQSPDQDTGYVVECDLDYPIQLRDAHGDYPLAPERSTVETDMLGVKQNQQHEAYS